jgi:AcrR family transcriptional regulator
MSRVGRRAEPLTRDEIATAALGIVDVDGLAALTMRSLGRALHCDPMAVYHHVHNREELLTLVAQSVLSEIELPSARLGDRRWLLELAARVRAVMHQHPHTASLFGHSQLSTGVGWAVIDAVVERLDRHRHRAPMVDRLNALIGAIIGYVSVELSPPAQVPRHVSLDDGEHFEHLEQHRDELLGHTFGMRGSQGGIVALPGGFELLMSTLVDGLLGPD